jgi:hypothetical protein
MGCDIGVESIKRMIAWDCMKTDCVSRFWSDLCHASSMLFDSKSDQL